MGMMKSRKCTVYSKACLFSALLRCFCNCLLAYHLYSLASQLQKPPCTAKKILRLQFAYIKKKRDRYTIFECERKFVSCLFIVLRNQRIFFNLAVYERSRPSVEIVTTLHGISLPLDWIAVFTACSIPPQQGTSIRTTVTLRTAFCRKISANFWE